MTSPLSPSMGRMLAAASVGCVTALACASSPPPPAAASVGTSAASSAPAPSAAAASAAGGAATSASATVAARPDSPTADARQPVRLRRHFRVGSRSVPPPALRWWAGNPVAPVLDGPLFGSQPMSVDVSDFAGAYAVDIWAPSKAGPETRCAEAFEGAEPKISRAGLQTRFVTWKGAQKDKAITPPFLLWGGKYYCVTVWMQSARDGTVTQESTLYAELAAYDNPTVPEDKKSGPSVWQDRYFVLTAGAFVGGAGEPRRRSPQEASDAPDFEGGVASGRRTAALGLYGGLLFYPMARDRRERGSERVRVRKWIFDDGWHFLLAAPLSNPWPGDRWYKAEKIGGVLPAIMFGIGYSFADDYANVGFALFGTTAKSRGISTPGFASNGTSTDILLGGAVTFGTTWDVAKTVAETFGGRIK